LIVFLNNKNSKNSHMHYLIIPGLHNSEAAHWQSQWENHDPQSFVRVQQNEWTKPLKSDWVDTLNNTIRRYERPVILVAHSLGCLTVAHWAVSHYSPFVAGALLVAPADVESTQHETLRSFAPIPLSRFSFPSIVVASTNDPYAATHRAAQWAAYWGSRFVSVGNKGHINTASNLGMWSEGLSLLDALTSTAQVVAAEPLAKAV
jgi:uncharacterized protein